MKNSRQNQETKKQLLNEKKEIELYSQNPEISGNDKYTQELKIEIIDKKLTKMGNVDITNPNLERFDVKK